MAETKFTRMKRIIETEKDKAIRGEATIASLTDEKQRILARMENQLGMPIENTEKAEAENEKVKSSIEADVEAMAAILTAEGYDI